MAGKPDPATSPYAGRLQLLVLQGTPFCNLDCGYCYLPNRNDTRRMDPATAAAAVRFVVGEGLAGPVIPIAWHAGEPTVLPPRRYAALFAAAQDAADGRVVTHAIQTNATLLDEAWCAFIVDRQVRVGVSIDGPATLHDRARIDRRGRGTHGATMRGIELLRAHAIPFHVIAVVGEETARNADAFLDFMADLGATEIGINFEEVEGANRRTSLAHAGPSSAMRELLARLIARSATDTRWRLRERGAILDALRDPALHRRTGNSENTPFAIVTVDADGGLYTYSPELAGVKNGRYADFRLGNVHGDGLAAIVRREPFGKMRREIARGVRRCAAGCAYYPLCGGGAPSNKVAEHGRFDGTQTLACRHAKMAVAEAVLARLEAELSCADPPDQAGVAKPSHAQPTCARGALG